MNNKNPLTVLVIDRPLKQGEKAVKDIFYIYGEKYGLIVFPPKEEDHECRIQIVFFKYNLMSDLESIFHTSVDYDIDDPPDFFDFDLTEIGLDTFYDLLNQKFEVQPINLTDVERK